MRRSHRLTAIVALTTLSAGLIAASALASGHPTDSGAWEFTAASTNLTNTQTLTVAVVPTALSAAVTATVTETAYIHSDADWDLTVKITDFDKLTGPGGTVDTADAYGRENVSMGTPSTVVPTALVGLVTATAGAGGPFTAGNDDQSLTMMTVAGFDTTSAYSGVFSSVATLTTGEPEADATGGVLELATYKTTVTVELIE